MLNTAILIIPLVIVLIVIAIVLITIYNNLIKTREMIYNAKGQIAAQIESRWDALTNLISATKEYSAHEKEVLENITKERTTATRNSSVQEMEKDDLSFQKALGQIHVVAENYPELKASDVYQNTMNQVDEYEDNVRHARMIYNDTVTRHNRNVQSFPVNLLAGPMGFTKEEYFSQTASKNDIPQW